MDALYPGPLATFTLSFIVCALTFVSTPSTWDPYNRSLVPSTVHAIVSTAIASKTWFKYWPYLIAGDTRIWTDEGPWEQFVGAVTCGYIVFDMCLGILHHVWRIPSAKPLLDLPMMTHHCIAAYTIGCGLVTGLGLPLQPVFIVSEASTPFVNIHAVLSTVPAASLGITEATKANLRKANGVCMWLVFGFFRVFLLSIVAWALYWTCVPAISSPWIDASATGAFKTLTSSSAAASSSSASVPRVLLALSPGVKAFSYWTQIGVVAPLYCLNWLWFYKITMGLIKAVTGKGSSGSTHDSGTSSGGPGGATAIKGGSAVPSPIGSPLRQPSSSSSSGTLTMASSPTVGAHLTSSSAQAASAMESAPGGHGAAVTYATSAKPRAPSSSAAAVASPPFSLSSSSASSSSSTATASGLSMTSPLREGAGALKKRRD